MVIVELGHFTRSNPDAIGIIFYANEDERDWYDMRPALTSWDVRTGAFIDAIYGAWAMVDPATMLVTNVEQDPSRLVPDNKILLGIDAHYGDIKPGMIYKDGELQEAAA